MSASHSAYYKLGLIGLALLRNWLKGDDKVSNQLISEAQSVIDEYKADPGNQGSQVPEFSVQEGYAVWADYYDQMPNLLLDAEQPITEQLLRALPKGAVVDMACGTGRYTSLLKELGHDVTGVDQSSAMLAVAKGKNPNIRYLQADISTTKLDSHSYDALVCALALSHFEEVDNPITEFARVVKKDGTLILSDIHPTIVAMGGHADFFKKDGQRGFVENHTHWHSEYIESFTKNNLEIQECIEPQLSWEHVSVLQQAFNLEPSTMKKALLDLPIALIWVLKKS